MKITLKVTDIHDETHTFDLNITQNKNTYEFGGAIHGIGATGKVTLTYADILDMFDYVDDGHQDIVARFRDHVG